MKSLNLLIIEDEHSQIIAYQDAIDSFNKKNNLQIYPEIRKTFSDGENALLSPYFDAAIIDLKLSSSDILEGQVLVERVYKKIRIPIFIVSGSISQIDSIPENILLRKRLRTELISEVLSEIVQIYNTGITSFLKPGGIIDEKLSEIFWTNLSKDLSIWIKENNQNSLLRYILTHFQEHLDIDYEGTFLDYHPSEVYIKPPIKLKLHTGDLVKYEDNTYIILTPSCDIVVQNTGSKDEKRNAENITLVKAKEFDCNTLCLNKKGELDKNKIESYVKNKSNRYHYLPSFESNNGFLIDFQEIISLKYDNNLIRLASISHPFIKDIISRFSNYYSRQGQPTFSQNKIVEHIFSLAQEKMRATS